MPAALPNGVRFSRDAALKRLRRKSRLERQNPAHGLNQSLVASTFDPVLIGTDNGRREQPVSGSVTVEITGASPFGLIYEMGGGSKGVKLGFDSSQELVAAAGDGTPASATGVDGAWADARITTIGARLRIVVGIDPGSGRMRIWVDGKIVITEDAVTPPFPGNQWTGNNGGSIGAAANGVHTNRLPLATAPVDFALVEPLRIFYNQLPQGFAV